MNVKLKAELLHYAELHATDDQTMLAGAFTAAAHGRELTAEQAGLLAAELRAELNDRWNPAHSWGGTGIPRPQVRRGALKLLADLQAAHPSARAS